MPSSIDHTCGPTELIERVIHGEIDSSELEPWVESVRYLYQRPNIRQGSATGTSPEPEKLIKTYLDWEDRVAELARALRHARDASNELARKDSESALKVLKAACVLAGLDPVDLNRASSLFLVGDKLRTLGRFHEAVSFLADAADILDGHQRESWYELFALKDLVICLREDKQFDEGLKACDRFLRRARQLGISACEAVALRQRGLILSRMGRPAAVEDLQRAVEISRDVGEEEAREYAMPDRGVFLSDLGIIARKRGRYETAIRALLEAVEFYKARNDRALEATAISDLGYVYIESGETERGARHLDRAADIADRVGLMRNATRWRQQALMLGGKGRTVEPASVPLSTPPEDSESPIEILSRVDLLIYQGKPKEGLELAEYVLDRAQTDMDFDVELRALCLVATCHTRLGDDNRAIPTLHKAIRLADSSDEAYFSRMARIALANAYIGVRKYDLAADVLTTALARGQVLLDSTDSTEIRQQIAAGIADVHDLFASFLSQTANHEPLINTTEMARARNLFGWMRATAYISKVLGGDELQPLLRELRAAEIRLEVEQIRGEMTAQQVQDIRRRSQHLRDALNQRLIARGVAPFSWSVKDELTKDVRSKIKQVTKPSDCMLFLFAVSDGVCAALAYRNDTDIDIRGRYIPWDDSKRRLAFSPWLATAGEGLSPCTFEAGMIQIRDSLFRQLLDLFHGLGPENLIVIPHAELALLPYWELLKLSGARGALYIAPSLEAYLLCALRVRRARGPTIFVPDITGSLRYSQTEFKNLQSARPEELSELRYREAIPDAALNSSVIHVAAHGVYNASNPYLSGFIVGEKAFSDSVFRQYVSAPLNFSETPNQEAWSLFTVAECAATLSLDKCRLVVLAACESGIPRLHRGGEMTGLPVAFLIAGAKSIIASLWMVDDAATATLMHHFYDIWKGAEAETIGVGNALRQARERLKLSTRTDVEAFIGPVRHLPEGEHPFSSRFYCDAFQCFGSD